MASRGGSGTNAATAFPGPLPSVRDDPSASRRPAALQVRGSQARPDARHQDPLPAYLLSPDQRAGPSCPPERRLRGCFSTTSDMSGGGGASPARVQAQIGPSRSGIGGPACPWPMWQAVRAQTEGSEPKARGPGLNPQTQGSAKSSGDGVSAPRLRCGEPPTSPSSRFASERLWPPHRSLRLSGSCVPP